MSLTLYNTLGRTMQEFVPRTAGKAGFYGCGPTVYNYAHIGNLRAYITHDLLTRTLRRRGYEVTHVMNITDVGHLTGDNDEGEDKMVRSAEERGKSVLEVADFYTKAFFADTERLNIVKPSIVCRATEHIDDMIALIKRIEEHGYTYSAGGNLYFDTAKFPHYGDLALLRLDTLKAGARTGVDVNKRGAADFVLWFTKSKFENQALTWDSPWGRGYPGWHIECSAMSIRYLGEQFDIHAGGIDHIPIHHTNEIAQSEAATGKSPWVKYWVHNEFLVLSRAGENGAKMSKSAGGFLTLQSLVDAGFDPLDYRLFLLGAHYRSQAQFSFESLTGARNTRKALAAKVAQLAKESGVDADATVYRTTEKSPGSPPDFRALPHFPLPTSHPQSLLAFDAALDEDLNTPKALAALWAVLKDTSLSPAQALSAALEMDSVLGLGLDKAAAEAAAEPALTVLDGEKEEIEALIAKRAAAKAAKNWAEADAIRASLKERGVILEDTPQGTTWRKT